MTWHDNETCDMLKHLNTISFDASSATSLMGQLKETNNKLIKKLIIKLQVSRQKFQFHPYMKNGIQIFKIWMSNIDLWTQMTERDQNSTKDT